MNKKVKEVTKEDPKSVCQFCHSSIINPVEWGPLYQLDGVTVHYFCLLFSSGLNQNGEDDEGILGFLPGDIRTEIKRGQKLKCKFCRKPNATIGCWKDTCKTSYHYPCGEQNRGVFQFIGGFHSYCSKHKKVKIPVMPNPKERCPICLHEVTMKESYLWPPCCKKDTLFHKRCLMRMGNSHGVHFFKCPLCNDKDVFSVAMRKAGVFLPDRDAAWETEPNAFAEQREQYKRCDAGSCLCPKGRAHSSKTDSKPWKIIRCGGCGSSAIHKLCGRLRNLTWRCATCAEILSDKRKSGVMALNSPRIQRDHHPHRRPMAISDLPSSRIEEGAIPPRKKIRLGEGDTGSSSGSGSSSLVALSVSTSERKSSSPSSQFESSSSGAESSSESESSSDSESDQEFVPRRQEKVNVAADSEGSGSTEDEEDDQDEVFISPYSNVYKQLISGVSEPKLVEPVKKLSLQRSSEKVTYPHPPSTSDSNQVIKSNNERGKPTAPPPPLIGSLSVPPLKMDVSVDDDEMEIEMDEWHPCLSPQVVLEESSSPLKTLELEDFNCHCENVEEMEVDHHDEYPDDDILISIVSCVSMAPSPEAGDKDEDEQRTDIDKTDIDKNEGLPQADPKSQENDKVLNSNVPISESQDKKDSESEGLPPLAPVAVAVSVPPDGLSHSTSTPTVDLDEEDSDIDIENVEPGPPAIMSLFKKPREVFTIPAPPSSSLSRIQRTTMTMNGGLKLKHPQLSENTNKGGAASGAKDKKKSEPEIIELDSDSDDDGHKYTVFGSNITLDLVPMPAIDVDDQCEGRPGKRQLEEVDLVDDDDDPADSY